MDLQVFFELDFAALMQLPASFTNLTAPQAFRETGEKPFFLADGCSKNGKSMSPTICFTCKAPFARPVVYYIYLHDNWRRNG